MRGRLLFVAGIAAGYVIGARAGRPAYDALMDRLRRTTADPRVQNAAGKAKDVLEDRAPQVADVVEKAAGTASAAASSARSAGATADGADEQPATGSTGSAS